MKKIFVLFVLFQLNIFLLLAKSNSSLSKKFNCELSILYPYYIFNYSNNINYGFGGIISDRIRLVKISTGLFYTSKKFYETYPITSGIKRIDYSLYYFNIPVIVDIPIMFNKLKDRISISTGFVLNIPDKFHSTTLFQNKESVLLKPSDYHSGVSLRLGAQFYPLYKLFPRNFVRINYDYKIKLDHLSFENNTPHYHPTVFEDKNMLSIAIGMEIF